MQVRLPRIVAAAAGAALFCAWNPLASGEALAQVVDLGAQPVLPPPDLGYGPDPSANATTSAAGAEADGSPGFDIGDPSASIDPGGVDPGPGPGEPLPPPDGGDDGGSTLADLCAELSEIGVKPDYCP